MTGIIYKSGIININKEKGLSSHNVVNQIRKILNIKRVGHAGTLDPNVTGVLPICFGKATRLSEYMLEDDKVYRGRIKLGVKTSTQDMTGEIIGENSFKPSYEVIINHSKKFIGPIMQTPPLYSAVRIKGKRLYEYAREGHEIDVSKRKVTIYEFTLSNYNYPYIDFVCSCSKGTYIRTLANDLGEEIGSLATLSDLERVKSGDFSISDSYKISEIEKLVKNKDFSFVNKMDSGISKLESLIIEDKLFKDLTYGRKIPVTRDVDGKIYKIYCKKKFIGTGSIIYEGNNYLKFNKMLYEE